MSLMKFDLEKVGVSDVSSFLPQVKKLKMVAMSTIVAMSAVECPLEWGAPDKPETYSKKSFRDALAPAWKELNEASSAVPKVEGIEFDLSQVSPEQFDELVSELDSNETDKMAEVMARFIKKCPKAWGDPTKKATYLNLKYYTQFLPVAQAISKAGIAELENFLKLLTSD